MHVSLDKVMINSEVLTMLLRSRLMCAKIVIDYNNYCIHATRIMGSPIIYIYTPISYSVCYIQMDLGFKLHITTELGFMKRVNLLETYSC